jgi:hypothetical protein
LLKVSGATARHPLLAPFVRPVADNDRLLLALAAFPIDPELPGLPGATDPDQIGPRLGLGRCQIEVVRHARRGRCVLRLVGETGQAMYAKIYRAGPPPNLGPLLAELHQRLGNVVVVPQVAHVVPELGLIALTEVAGTPTLPGLVRARVTGGDGADLEAAVARAARVAAALHASDARVPHEHHIEDDLEEVRAGLRFLLRSASAFARRIAPVVASVEAAASRTAPLPFVSSHGDFTPSQLLFAGDRVALADFDDACRAEPALDIGRMSAYLRLAVRKAEGASIGSAGTLGPDLARHLRDVYVASYGIDPVALEARVAVWEKITVLRIALGSWQQLKPSRVRIVLDVLDSLETRGPVLAAQPA